MNLKVPKWVEDGLKKAARDEGRTASDMIAGAVAYFLSQKQGSVTPFTFPQADDYKDDEPSTPREKRKKSTSGLVAGGLPIEGFGFQADAGSASARLK